MSNKQTSVRISFPFLSFLLLAFVILKLAGIGVVATWSWLWVLSPIWLPFVLIIVFVVIWMIIDSIINRR